MIDFLRKLPLWGSPRILDLGAHVGEFAKLAKEVWPKAWVACVEASDECLPYLVPPLADETKRAVLWDEPFKRVEFYKRRIDACGGSTGNSCFRETTGFFSDDEIAAGNVWIEPRRTTTLDRLYGNAEPFDLVKLDLQGAELRAILGGKRVVAPATYLVCEQSRAEYNAGAPLAPEVDAAIRSLGFRLAWESEHDVVGKFQIDRIYVNRVSAADERLRRRGR